LRILFFGDIFGRSGRDALAAHLPALRARLAPDIVIANGENMAHGAGMTAKTCDDLFSLGINVVTSGNHAWDQSEIYSYIDREQRLLRPLNYPGPSTPGRGACAVADAKGRTVLVVNLMGQVHMGDPLDNPFAAAAALFDRWRLGREAAAIFVDFHAEATSEKMAMGHFLDGRVSAVVGTHTHVPTADAQILPGGTGFQSDAGMCGDYDSVIGVRKDIPLYRFTRGMKGARFEPAAGEATVCGTLIVTDDRTGLAQAIAPVRIGPRLRNEIPEI